jgi:hypothetical protein
MFLRLYNIYIKVTSKHARIRLLRCVQIATPSVPYFRSFAISNKQRTNGQLHFYIYRYVKSYESCWEIVSVTNGGERPNMEEEIVVS